MTYVELNGHACYCDSEGSGYPLLYLHGGFGGCTAPGGASAEKPWMDSFRGRYRVVSYDRRWSGRTAGPSTDVSLGTFVEDALAVLDHHRVERAVVWAVSAGCPIGLTLAHAHPERVSALVLSDGSPWFSRDEELLAKLRDRLDVLDKQGPEAAYEARKASGTVGLRVFSGDPAARSEAETRKQERQRLEMKRRLASLSSAERVAGYAGELRTQKAFMAFDLSDRLHELQMPTLAVFGSRDQVFPDAGWRSHASSVPNLTSLELEDGTHGCGQSPEAIRQIVAFLGTLGL